MKRQLLRQPIGEIDVDLRGKAHAVKDQRQVAVESGPGGGVIHHPVLPRIFREVDRVDRDRAQPIAAADDTDPDQP